MNDADARERADEIVAGCTHALATHSDAKMYDWETIRVACEDCIAAALAADERPTDRERRLRGDERERNCAAICAECATWGSADYQDDPTPMYWHGARECKATPIRLAALAAPASAAPPTKENE